MSNSMGEINKAIRELRHELCGVYGDASVEKQDACMAILERIEFYTTAKLLFDTKPKDVTHDITLNELTRGT